MIQERTAEFSAEELREFLEADRWPAAADPRFKEELRESLWALVSAPRGEDPGQGDDH